MRVLVFVLLIPSLLPAAAVAGVEVTVAAGHRSGDAAFPIEATGPLILCITTPCVLAEAHTEDDRLIPSLIVDVPVGGGWLVEGLLTWHDGDLELRSGFPPGALDRETFDATTLLVGAQRRWGDGRLRPFAAAAIGATTFESSARAYERPIFPGIVATPVDEDVPAASLAGGVLAELGARLAARLEARAFWHELPRRLGGALVQAELSVGLTYRF